MPTSPGATAAQLYGTFRPGEVLGGHQADEAPFISRPAAFAAFGSTTAAAVPPFRSSRVALHISGHDLSHSRAPQTFAQHGAPSQVGAADALPAQTSAVGVQPQAARGPPAAAQPLRPPCCRPDCAEEKGFLRTMWDKSRERVEQLERDLKEMDLNRQEVRSIVSR